MVFGLYGNYTLVLREILEKNKNVTLKQFMELKPQLTSGILDKLENLVTKLVVKGHTRHTIVQAVLCDYVECQTDMSKLENLADLLKEKMPALLASYKGLKVACALFNILDAKNRKIVVKSLPITEMITNRISHLFVIHVTNTLDDTQLTKKKILHEALKVLDDHIDDTCYRNVLYSALSPLQSENDQLKSCSYLTQEESQCLSFFLDKSTSKKARKVRAAELTQIVQKPLEMFFEEKLQYQLVDTKANPVMKALFSAIAASKFSSNISLG